MNSCHSQTHGLGKMKGTKGIKASGLSDAYYILSLWWANGVMVGGQNHSLQMHLLEGTSRGIKPEGLLGWQIHMRMS